MAWFTKAQQTVKNGIEYPGSPRRCLQMSFNLIQATFQNHIFTLLSELENQTIIHILEAATFEFSMKTNTVNCFLKLLLINFLWLPKWKFLVLEWIFFFKTHFWLWQCNCMVSNSLTCCLCVHVDMCVSACFCECGGLLNNSWGCKDDFKTKEVFIHLHILLCFILP